MTLTLGCLAAFIAFFVWFLPPASQTVAGLFSQWNQAVILVYGIDATPGVQRSDTIMLVRLDTAKNRIGVLSIPRDTLIYLPSIGETKINHSFAFGGTALLQKAVTQLTGLPIPYFIQLNPAGVVNIVDGIGGIDLNIKRRMYYNDYAGHLFVNFQPGLRHLSGVEAAAYLRFRHDPEGDIGRIRRQQGFLETLAGEILSGNHLFQLPTLLGQLSPFIKTNLPLPDQVSLVNHLKSVYAHGKVEMDSLPGVPVNLNGVSYWQLQESEAKACMDRILFGLPTANTVAAN